MKPMLPTRPRISARLLRMLPETWRSDTQTFFAIVNRTFGGFLRAQLVQALFYGMGTAVLMASHNADLTARVADQVIDLDVLDDGAIDAGG